MNVRVNGELTALNNWWCSKKGGIIVLQRPLQASRKAEQQKRREQRACRRGEDVQLPCWSVAAWRCGRNGET